MSLISSSTKNIVYNFNINIWQDLIIIKGPNKTLF